MPLEQTKPAFHGTFFSNPDGAAEHGQYFASADVAKFEVTAENLTLKDPVLWQRGSERFIEESLAAVQRSRHQHRRSTPQQLHLHPSIGQHVLGSAMITSQLKEEQPQMILMI